MTCASAKPYAMLSLAITQRCNLRCAHCYTSAGAPTPELEEAALLRLLHEFLSEYSPATAAIDVTVTGGEPLLRPQTTLRLLNAAASHPARREGDDLALNTNAMLVDGPLATSLAEVPLLRIWVSLDGNRAAHDALRGRSYDSTIAGIERLSRAGCRVGVGLTPSLENSGTVMQAAATAFDAGADRFVVQFPMMVGRWAGTELAGRMASLNEELRELHREYGERVGSPLQKMESYREGAGCQGCPVGRNVTFHVMPTGEIYPCYALIGTPFSVGTADDWPRSFQDFSARLARFNTHRDRLSEQLDVGCLVSCPGTVVEGGQVPPTWQRLDEALRAFPA